jgi:hypothetical protein
MAITILGVLGVLVVYFTLKKFAPSAPSLLLTGLWAIFYIGIASFSKAGGITQAKIGGLFIYMIGSIILFTIVGRRAPFWIKSREEAEGVLADSSEVERESLEREAESVDKASEAEERKTQVKLTDQDYYFTLIRRLAEDEEVKELINHGYNRWRSGNITEAIDSFQLATTKADDIKLLTALHIEIARLGFINREFTLVSENLTKARKLASEVGHKQVEQEIERMLSELPLQNTYGGQK